MINIQAEGLKGVILIVLTGLTVGLSTCIGRADDTGGKDKNVKPPAEVFHSAPAKVILLSAQQQRE